MRWGTMVCLLLAWVGREDAQARVAAGTVECGALTADLNRDGVVDFADFFIFADQFGLTCVAPADSETTGAMEFVYIAPGTFMMGKPSSEFGGTDELPQHQVTISKGYYLGKYEITQGQWESVVGTQPWSAMPCVQEGPNYPASYISWDDIQVFIHKLNQAVGDSVYRLPTEAEWEYACRAGTATAWSFSGDENVLKDYAWYVGNVGEPFAPHAVGTKRPNPWDLYDMYGNVSEWVQDLYGAYSSGDQTDPVGASSGSYRVLRGGSIGGLDARGTRSASRAGTPPGDRGFYSGARLLRTR